MHGRHHEVALAAHRIYLNTLARARAAFQETLPDEIKKAGTDKLWKLAHPQGKTSNDILPPSTHHNYCSTLFDLPAEAPPIITEVVDPANLALFEADVGHALDHGFRASGSQGSSILPSQLLCHLNRTARGPLAQFF